MPRIAVYSGSFDPVHLGHKSFVEDAILQADLSQVIILPEPKPRNKQCQASIEDRIKMLEIQFSDNDKVSVSMDRVGDSHKTEPVLKALSEKYDLNDSKLFLLMGADVFLNVDKWQDFDILVKNFNFIVALRSEDDGEEVVLKQADMPEVNVLKIVTNNSTLSSTKVRQDIIDTGNSINIDQKVSKYIEENSLYQYS